MVAALIELTLWLAVFRGSGRTELAGFGETHYLAYALWAAFVARVTSTWMYEFRMVEEIESGSVNGVLVRPISFFEYYLSQFMGYKLATTLLSLLIPVAAVLYFDLPGDLRRVPAVLLHLTYYLVLVHVMSFCVATAAFRLNKSYSLTVAKNLALWLFSGELFPIDLLPSAWKQFMLALPFANSVYIPVAYLTGRGDGQLLLQGFLTTTYGLIFFGALAAYLWRSGLKTYTGTGA